MVREGAACRRVNAAARRGAPTTHPTKPPRWHPPTHQVVGDSRLSHFQPRGMAVYGMRKPLLRPRGHRGGFRGRRVGSAWHGRPLAACSVCGAPAATPAPAPAPAQRTRWSTAGSARPPAAGPAAGLGWRTPRTGRRACRAGQWGGAAGGWAASGAHGRPTTAGSGFLGTPSDPLEGAHVYIMSEMVYSSR